MLNYELIKSAPLDQIIELYREAGWLREGEFRREIIAQIIEKSFCFMVAREPDSGLIVGMGRALSDGVSDAYIQDVVVRKSHRRRGIGRELVRLLTNHCLKAHISWIALVAEPGTADFYRSLGYQVMEAHQPMLFRGAPALG